MNVATLLIAVLIVQLCCAVSLLVMSSRIAGLTVMRWFGWAYTVLALGLALTLLTDANGTSLAVFLGRCLVLTGAVLLTQGVSEFVVPDSSALIWGGMFLLLFAVGDLYFMRTPARLIMAIVVFCVAYAAQLLIAVLILLSHPDAAERTACRATAVLLGLMSALALARAVIAPWRVFSTDLAANDPMRFGGMILYLILTVGMAFGFVWMATSRLRSQLENQARTDSLTGVLNRRALELAGNREIAECGLRNSPLSVLAVDLDHFKLLNDTHGHGAGDAVLAASARWLSQGLRSTDLVARFGGEEFIVMLPHRNAARAFEIAERLRLRFEAMVVDYEGQQLRVTASFGVAAYNGDTWSELLRRADHALYEAKQAGRNRTRCDTGQLAAGPPRERRIKGAAAPVS